MKLHIISTFIISLILVASCKSKTPDESTRLHNEDLLSQGKELAMDAQASLGKNLMAAIQSGGTGYAISFCSEKALEITDSVANDSNARIKRVSDNNRNPKNAATGSELQYIINAKQSLLAGDVIKPQLEITGDKKHGYYPILTNELCIQCHGDQGSDITESTLNELKRLYPEDKAIGYGVNELRGIWVIELDKIDK